MGNLGKYSGLKCPVCDKALKNAVDTAVCPTCGTPHHRACWHELGHCVNEHLHGTGFVFEAPSDAASENPAGGDRQGHICPRCRSMSTSDTLFCPYCGYAFGDARYSPEEDAQQYDVPPVSPFSAAFADPLGGVDPTETIDGVAISDMALFIGPNTHRYLPRFVDLCHRKPKRTSWNWGAFLFPQYWFAFRKMYREAVVTTIVSLIFPLLSYPLLSLLLSELPQTAGIYDLWVAIAEQTVKDPNFIPPFVLILACAGTALNLAFRVVCGLFADYIYMKHAVAAIKKISGDDEIEDRELYIRAGGSVNFFAAFIAMFATLQLSQLLSMLVF